MRRSVGHTQFSGAGGDDVEVAPPSVVARSWPS